MGLFAGGLGAGALITLLLTAFLAPHVLNLYGSVGTSMGATGDGGKSPYEVHATVEFYKDGKLVFAYSHPGEETKLGYNITLAKLSGDSGFNLTTYNLNTTFVSIGNQGTLTNSSTVLPGEWNRTAGTVEDLVVTGETYSFNVTATIYPDTGGPYTADCIGVNYEDGIGNNALYGYDTFNEVTGIDETFTINIEFQISVTYS